MTGWVENCSLLISEVRLRLNKESLNQTGVAVGPNTHIEAMLPDQDTVNPRHTLSSLEGYRCETYLSELGNHCKAEMLLKHPCDRW